MAASKKVFVKTFGCQMNVYDFAAHRRGSGRAGYLATAAIEDADMVILNTCHIREKAAEKVYSDLGRIRQLKAQRQQQGKETLVAVAGCVAQAEGREIVRRAPVVDLVVGPQSYHRLGDLVARTRLEGQPRSRPLPGGEQVCRLAAAKLDAAASRLPDGAGRLRQVLHILRGALYARR